MQEQRPVSKENLSNLSRWAGLVSIVTIITGILSAILGLFALIIGAIPGVIAVILGLKLYHARNNAEKLLEKEGESDPEELNLLFKNLVTYFQIQGILIIIGLGVILFTFISGFLALLFNY